ncbi:MAG: hypothetical protein KDJ88_14740 [Bauldia sp.]|nr:hypothetical protein [Bauldia sp.]
MADQLIDTSVAAPVVADGVIIVATSGSISSNNAGTALTLNGSFTAFIDGSIHAINDWAVFASGADTSASLEISENARIIAVSSPGANAASGIIFDGPYGELVNHGYVFGTFVGIGLEGLASGDQQSIENYGGVVGQYAVDVITTGTITVNNYDGAIIEGHTTGIHADSPGAVIVVNNAGMIAGPEAISVLGTLQLHNTGVIIGAVRSGGSATAAANGSIAGGGAAMQLDDGADGSTIVNTGKIIAGEDGVAIELGDGADTVRNKGSVDGLVNLGGGNDRFVSNGTADTVHGGAGRDVIRSGGGGDWINGGAGRDKIKPGRGKDVIVHEQGDGKDKVFHFKPGKDVLDLSDHNFSGFGDLSSAITGKGNKVVIDLTGSDQIVLSHVDKADLSAHDFIL